MANDSRSSRFMNSRGHLGPSASRSRTSSSIGVACGASDTLGRDINAARAVAISRTMLSESQPGKDLGFLFAERRTKKETRGLRILA
jgi:hypothetical protein